MTRALSVLDGFYRPNNRFRLVYGPLVTEDAQVILTIAGPPPVVAFHPGGEELLVVRRNEAVILSTFGCVSVALRLDLTSIADALRLTGVARRRSRDQDVDPLLVHYGSAWALAKARPQELSKLPGISRARARRLSAAVRTLRPPRRVRMRAPR